MKHQRCRMLGTQALGFYIFVQYILRDMESNYSPKNVNINQIQKHKTCFLVHLLTKEIKSLRKKKTQRKKTARGDYDFSLKPEKKIKPNNNNKEGKVIAKRFGALLMICYCWNPFKEFLMWAKCTRGGLVVPKCLKHFFQDFYHF